MKVIIAQALISVLYVFDASASPILHIPLSFLTLLYMTSIVELYGFFRLIAYARRRLTRASAGTEQSHLFGPS